MQLKRITFFMMIVFAFVTLISGCATERQINPTLAYSPRAGLDLSPPVLCSVFDGRSTPEKTPAAPQLLADLKRIYGASIEETNYFSKSVTGRVAVRLRIVTLGANFGNRLVSSAAYADAVSSAQGSATGAWGTVVGNVSTQQSVFAGSFSGEGWWNGAAWVDLEIQDNRGAKPISFTLPIVAEHRESNMWGYSSGDKAAQVAWRQVSDQLTRALDTVFRTVRDGQIQ